MISDPQTTIEKQNAIPDASKSRNRLLWGLIGGIIVVIVLLGTFLTLLLLGAFASPSGSKSGTGTTVQQTATAASGSTSTPGAATATAQPGGDSVSSQQAMTAITQYYADINAKNYQAAYTLWGAAYQRSTSYQQFASGFATTQNDVVQVNTPTALSNVTVAFWSFRLMVGAGLLMGLLALVGLFFLVRKQLEQRRWFLWVLVLSIAFPYLANTCGWVLTEMGRQPWLVFGLLTTSAGVSPSVSPGMILFTLIGFILLYGVLGVVDAALLFKYARQDIETAAIKVNADEQDEELSITL